AERHELKVDKELFELKYVNNFQGDLKCSQIENTASYSIIPSCYMIYETNLVEFAKIARNYFSLNLKYSDLSGGKIERIKKYLKLADINISKIKSWNSLIDLEVIRDCIIHNEGKVNITFKKINSLESLKSKYSKHFSINKPLHENEKYLIIKFSMCESFLNHLQSFFDDLIELFGLNKDFLAGADVSEQKLKERVRAKEEYEKAVMKAREIYDRRMKFL
ncbi:MAG: hypothetical protein MJB14_24005, partial [Spirochaetes bacterium]|nr:hypothetical protein [Spirochaetota bacterium]